MIREASGDGTIYRRVLDLLAGWADYVDKCADGYPDEKVMYEREADRIHELYQRLGAMSGPYRELDLQAMAMLEIEVKDLLKNGVSPSRGTDGG